MNTIDDILDAVAVRESCIFSAPCGLPEVDGELSLPSDVIRFYSRCGGLIVNKDGECGSRARIVTPSEFKRIDETILGGEMFATGPFRFWYALVDVEDCSYLAIDIGPEHNGKCIDSFHETFAMPGYVDVVASSFTDLLLRLLNHPEDSAFWLQDDFSPLGEAFELYGYKSIG